MRRKKGQGMASMMNAWRSSAITMDVMAASAETASRLAERQARRLASLLAHAKQHSALFAKRLADIDPATASLADLPISHRDELMAAFDQWVCDPALKLTDLRGYTADEDKIAALFNDKYTVWESSGTSGLPGIFVQDIEAMTVYDALEALRRSDPDPWRRVFNPLSVGERWAFVGATGGHFASLVSLLRLRRLNPLMASSLQAFSIMQPTADLVAQLNDWSPTVLATYPTAAAMLADEAAAGRLRCRPHAVWTGGETLMPAVRSHVEKTLGSAVRNSYGASEFLPIAWECRCQQLHVNADWVILEAVDDQGRAVPPGQPSATTLLTNLANKVQPLIRYDLGDCIVLSPEPCACGSALPVLEVQGRQDDPLTMAGAKGHTITLLPMALSTVLEEEAGVYDYELLQRDAHTLVLRLPLSEAEAQEPLRRGCAALLEFMRQQGVAKPKALGEAVPQVQRGRSGKARRVQAMASR